MAGKIYYQNDEGERNSIAVYRSDNTTHIAIEMSIHQSTLPLDAVRELIASLQEMLAECEQEAREDE